MSFLNRMQFKVLEQIVVLGKATLGKIAQKTGMHRRSAKIIILSLKKKNIIYSDYIGNREYYSADTKESIISKFETETLALKNEIELLKQLYATSKNSQIINAVKGIKGLRTVLIDEIIKGKDICAFHLFPIDDELKKEFEINDIRRKNNNIHLKLITNWDFSSKENCEIRRTAMKSNINCFVYGNKITIIYKPNTTNDLEIYTIKISEIAKLFRERFETVWKKSKSATKKASN